METCLVYVSFVLYFLSSENLYEGVAKTLHYGRVICLAWYNRVLLMI